MAKQTEHTGQFHRLAGSEATSGAEGWSTPARIRVLLVEDGAEDAELVLYQLRQQGIHCVAHCVDTEAAMREALITFQPDLILSDFSLPRFDGLSALEAAQ